MTDIPKAAAHPLSPIKLPLELHFADDQAGLEARMLLAGWAQRLEVAAAQHEPVQVVRDIVARIMQITTDASHREMTKLADTARAN